MYYTIVIIIAIILLIGSLSVIGVMMTSSSNKKAFPDFQNVCPDYWTMSATNNATICMPPISGINIPNEAVYSGSKPTIDHSGVTWIKKTDKNKGAVTQIDLSTSNWMSVCDKKSWANANAIVWDGVSNNNGC
jgi:hypothetical protein